MSNGSKWIERTQPMCLCASKLMPFKCRSTCAIAITRRVMAGAVLNGRKRGCGTALAEGGKGRSPEKQLPPDDSGCIALTSDVARALIAVRAARRFNVCPTESFFYSSATRIVWHVSRALHLVSSIPLLGCYLSTSCRKNIIHTVVTYARITHQIYSMSLAAFVLGRNSFQGVYRM
uniref:Uncharacterized protein n=1 Tax=Steinernema glaseri TaxID=37863 RepID=A0A1I7Z3G1_9BILA